MSKTLTEFRAERGLYLKDVAEAIDVPIEELQAVENGGAMPPHIAEKLVAYYGLPQDYFYNTSKAQAPILKKTPEKPMKYFLGESLVWTVIIAVVSGLPAQISMVADTVSIMISSFTGGQMADFIVEGPVFSIFKSIWSTVSTVLLCIAFANSILKRTTFVGNIKRNQFVNYLIPNGMVMALSFFDSMLYFLIDKESSTALILIPFITAVISLGITILGIYLLAVMLNLSIESDVEKRNKKYKQFAIITTVSVLITFISNIVVMVATSDFRIFTVIRTFILYGLYIVIARMFAKLHDGDEKQENLVCTILPLAFYGVSLVLGVVGAFV